MDINCTLCGKPIPEDDPDFYDHDFMGYVHQSCLEEHEDDEYGRAADFWCGHYGDR